VNAPNIGQHLALPQRGSEEEASCRSFSEIAKLPFEMARPADCGLGFRVWGLEFGFRVEGQGFRVCGLGLKLGV